MQRMGLAYSTFQPIASLFGVRASLPAIRQGSSTAPTGQSVMPRKVKTGETLAKLEKVKNVRDLAEACSNIRPGMLFRSACPHPASNVDVAVLREELRIRQLVDLRSAVERAEDGDCLLLRNAEVMDSAMHGSLLERETFHIRNNYDALPPQPANGAAPSTGNGGDAHAGAATSAAEGSAGSGADDDLIEDLPPPQPPSLTVHHIALLEKNRYYRSLLTRLPRMTSAAAVFWSLVNLDRAKSLVLKEVNSGGLPQLYEILLDSASRELCIALKVIRAAAERGEATLFFCKIGKDRTGLTAALVLSACGATRDEIISDYNRSDGADGVQVALGGLEHDKALKDLDVVAFSKAPREAMAATLDYIERAYGGVTPYLDSIGFGEDERDRLRAALTNGISTPDVKPGHSQDGSF